MRNKSKLFKCSKEEDGWPEKTTVTAEGWVRSGSEYVGPGCEKVKELQQVWWDKCSAWESSWARGQLVFMGATGCGRQGKARGNQGLRKVNSWRLKGRRKCSPRNTQEPVFCHCAHSTDFAATNKSLLKYTHTHIKLPYHQLSRLVTPHPKWNTPSGTCVSVRRTHSLVFGTQLRHEHFRVVGAPFPAAVDEILEHWDGAQKPVHELHHPEGRMHRRQVSTAAAGLLPARQPRAGIGCFSASGKIVPLPLLPFPLKNPYFFSPFQIVSVDWSKARTMRKHPYLSYILLPTTLPSSIINLL